MIPARVAEEPSPWIDLDPQAKRRRLLDVAAEVFTEHGLSAPMPAVAQAAGIGVGSLYRCCRSKDDLIAAIVIEQMSSLRDEILVADRQSGAGLALERTMRRLVEWQARNGLVKTALAVSSDRHDVRAAVGEVNLAWQELLDRARKQGSLRRDATTMDLRLIFAATRAADELQPGARERMLELLLYALRDPRTPGK